MIITVLQANKSLNNVCLAHNDKFLNGFVNLFCFRFPIKEPISLFEFADVCRCQFPYLSLEAVAWDSVFNRTSQLVNFEGKGLLSGHVRNERFA